METREKSMKKSIMLNGQYLRHTPAAASVILLWGAPGGGLDKGQPAVPRAQELARGVRAGV